MLVAAALDLLDESLDSVLYFQLLLCFCLYRGGIGHGWFRFGRLSVGGHVAWIVLFCFHICFWNYEVN